MTDGTFTSHLRGQHFPIIAVVGATATGKSDLALGLAQSLSQATGKEKSGGSEFGQAEIVSADSMQLYRGMDIGTAKTPLEERRGVPHHQIDILEVYQDASVAVYQREGRADIAGIHARGAQAIVAGGSGLYIQALLDVINFPGVDLQVRAALEREGEEKGTLALYERLCTEDPVAGTHIDAHNTRRIIRALEVITLTGQPYSAQLPTREYYAPTLAIGVRRDNVELDSRIYRRARAMFERGLVEETRALTEIGLREGKTAVRATGYAQALAVIDGCISNEEAIESVALATRQLSRRQIKWFRRDPRIRWFTVTESSTSGTNTSVISDEDLLPAVLAYIEEMGNTLPVG